MTMIDPGDVLRLERDKEIRTLFKAELAAKLEVFYNDCHIDTGEDGGRFCETGSESAGSSGSVSTSKASEAFTALRSGKSVDLKQGKDLVKLVQKIGEAVPDPTKGPVMDLCKVKGFCNGTKDIPRADMPQLKGIPVAGSKADGLTHLADGRVNLGSVFLQSLRDNGIKVVEKKPVGVGGLKPTQNEINGARVSQVLGSHNKVSGVVYVSNDGHILDGHHHWAAAKVQGSKSMDVIHIDMPIRELVDYTNKFTKEWGVPHKTVGD